MHIFFEKIVTFDQFDVNYTYILEKDTRFIETCRGRINFNYLLDKLEHFTHGFIHLSEYKPLRKIMNREERKQFYGIDESTSEESENMEKFIINGFLLFTMDNNSIYLDILCVNDNYDKDKKLPHKLMSKLFTYADENNIVKINLHASNGKAFEFYLKYGFVYTPMENDRDNYFMYVNL